MRIAAGEKVRVERRDTEWPAFVFVHGRGGTGWVPARYLSASEGDAQVRVPYDTRELVTAAGEQLTVLLLDEESGWLQCTNEIDASHSMFGILEPANWTVWRTYPSSGHAISGRIQLFAEQDGCEQ